VTYTSAHSNNIWVMGWQRGVESPGLFLHVLTCLDNGATCLAYVSVCSVCCSVLQCVAVRCSVLQCVAVRCSVSQCVAVCYSALQHVAHVSRGFFLLAIAFCTR